ncbi:MAG: hypothetical protein UX99_C0003G0005 [Candidatus Amesbacteria bacterium GW2011_GWB1_47_26]|uniref:Uncharacterized protein n=1 Tax=Candidatus Amesbacteria bacterium GW2011_GWC2_45_19 TaxID=1618366 RepID=A0A0G1M4K5_9BACT|nr:MAG: hypothetical protein UX05_C0003G0005 [Candidatus Amesbacteria bacterium GW2011_GWC2_45_19]KKU38625.1 MAG: hypothetical protein UX52_C0002G0005 [Candidatus Amesbacteria bacterium GW2011_GWA1_46_35]KKU68671.1 MAG: hypothetical protein UX93_C0006G0088 [Microgenomates group bacterium GW2011_GWC1_47_20]KKU74945.1 MAG: hypothetical protein UX99_C0003G0005 [Candidatus Amesbacteria bacterium GW2011_GWB1_47_26]KKU80244.1 MAG: hypothetical protein UY06_C0003G0006 [Candidatus Amesbacteria bacteriu
MTAKNVKINIMSAKLPPEFKRYFWDADSADDKTPRMLNDIPWEKTWESVKAFF